LAETEATLLLLARLVGCESQGIGLLQEFRERLAPAPPPAARPRVFFEEWNVPLITGIAWVGELIQRAGGVDIFASLHDQHSASGRVVAAGAVRRAEPEIIIASWCGKTVDVAEIVSRPNWGAISAVRQRRVYELPSSDILQPGFRLVYGYDRIKQVLQSPACVAALSH
jgi:iron complex transport system substrate-binding protein